MSRDTIITQDLPVPVDRVGIADIVGFGQDGVVILRNSVQPDIRTVISSFGYNAGGWRVEKHVRLLGDTTGNRRADIIGFGDEGILISRNNGNNTFGPSVLSLRYFGTKAGGWTNDKHIRYVADLRNNGFVDIIGFGDAGVLVSLNDGHGNFSKPRLALKEFGYISGGWKIERHLRFLADTTGNGLPDIVGFADSSVIVALNNGDGTFSPGKDVTNDFTYSSGGWRMEKHPRFVADLTGDGTVDIIGFSDAGVVVAIGNGDGTFQSSNLVLEAFGYNRGWRVDQHPRFIADVNGNGCGDIVGFASDGVYVALNKGNGTFDTPKRVVEGFGTNQGFRVDKHPRFLADLTGNGTADIIGFGESWVWVSYNDGAGNFSSPAHKLTDKFAFNDGQWAVDKTVRWVTNMVRS